MPEDANPEADLSFLKITANTDFPRWAKRPDLIRFFNETMKPYHDTPEDVASALDYALDPGRAGFVMLAHEDEKLLGALTMLDSGMGGYIPRWILLFVSVQPDARGGGIGRRLIERSLAECDGPVKLHVEYDNPAKRLYERMGFVSKYAEMRWEPSA
ncbi:GNAT family N-acetyltransferase [bacterium]|nr:GNAT family N-acetyltransferase [bacterium]